MSQNNPTLSVPPTDSMEPAPQHDWRRIMLFAAIIIFAGFFVAAPAFQGTWLWDDDQEIVANVALRSVPGLKEIWKGTIGADYLPVKATILWAEYHLWELDNVAYHAINAVWHVLNALLLWHLFSRLRVKWAWIGGLLFAVHPVLVESVAWVSEQKNTISLIFMLASAIAYLNYDERRKTGSLVWSIMWFVLAALSKSAVIMLPYGLLLYLWWRRDKFEFRDILLGGALAGVALVALGVGLSVAKFNAKYLAYASLPGLIIAPVCYLAWSKIKGPEWREVRRQILSISPYVVISVLLACVTVYFQFKNAIGGETIPVGGYASRTVIAGMSVFFYLFCCIWPFDLIPIYPRWVVPDHPPLWMYLPWLAILITLLVFWRFRKTWGRHAIFGLGFFFINIVPVLGFVTMSYMRITWVADHFLYISIIGVIGLAIAGAAVLYDKLPAGGKPWAAGLGACVIGCLAWNASLYSNVFLNESNMWEYTLSKNADAWQAHSRYGKVLLDRGDLNASFYHIQQSHRLRPDLAETNNNMGVLMLRKKRNDEALAYFKRSTEIMPMGAFMLNYANALLNTGHGREAPPYYERVLSIDPNAPSNPTVLGNYGVALLHAGRLNDAVPVLESVLKLQPGQPDAVRNLGIARQAQAAVAQSATTTTATSEAVSGTGVFTDALSSTAVPVWGMSASASPVPAPAATRGTGQLMIPQIFLNK